MPVAPLLWPVLLRWFLQQQPPTALFQPFNLQYAILLLQVPLSSTYHGQLDSTSLLSFPRFYTTLIPTQMMCPTGQHSLSLVPQCFEPHPELVVATI
jgi:hypothetical protein